jgi:hypothetical protein
LEQTISKAILEDEPSAKQQPTVEFLYNRYSGMLFSYILQFIPDRMEAEELLVDVFALLAPQLERALDPPSNICCWMQVEARKMVLAHLRNKGDGQSMKSSGSWLDGQDKTYYFSLLTDASPEHQWVFRELFIYGEDKEGVARRCGKDLAYVTKILRESLLLIRNKLG